MPPGSKKRAAIKRKMEATNHQSPTNSIVFQGNGPGGGGDDNDNNDHPFTDEDFSPRTAMEAPPEPMLEPAVSEDVSVVPIEQKTVSESEQTEVNTGVASEVSGESSAPQEVGEKEGEGTEIPVVALRDAPSAGTPLLERRASWWNCFGFLRAFWGSER